MDYYEKLREKLDLFPIGLPRTEDTMRMLTLLFNEDDIRLAAYVPNPPLMFSSRRIADKAGTSTDEAVRRLSGMAANGLIIEVKILGEKKYSLMPAVPGFMEMQFMSGREITPERREAGLLWHKALDGEFGRENYGYPTSGVRVVPIKRSVNAEQRIYSFEEMEKVIRDSGSLGVTECACRKSAQKCSAPLEVCMVFNVMAEYLIEKNMARKVTRREIFRKLEEAADAGLVHTTTNCKPPVSIICNCCSCCCASLRGVVSLKKPSSSIASNFRSSVSKDAKCILCGRCARACPVQAISKGEKHMIIDENKCIGCGVCAHRCKTSSLILIKRDDAEPFRSSIHLSVKMIEERNKGPRLIKNISKEIFDV